MVCSINCNKAYYVGKYSVLRTEPLPKMIPRELERPRVSGMTRYVVNRRNGKKLPQSYVAAVVIAPLGPPSSRYVRQSSGFLEKISTCIRLKLLSKQRVL
jgi:hypothetical protein